MAESQPRLLVRWSEAGDVGDVGLDDADGASAHALHQPGREQRRHRAREGEEHVRGGGDEEAREDRRAAAVAVGDTSPDRRHGELGDRERGDQHTDGRGAGPEIGGIVGQEGHDHGEPHHVHERDDEQNQQLAHWAISASTSAVSRGARESHSAPRSVTR